MKHGQVHAQLVELGLGELEARTYVALLKGGPATAYSVGRTIGKPTANVYKAADALEARGAIISSSGQKRILRPVAPEEFLAHLRRRQGDLLDSVAAGLEALRSAPQGVGLYRLENVDAVIERARRMLGSAVRLVAVDAFPGAIERVRGDIEAAHGRGVAVHVQVYERTSIRCASLVEVGGGAEVVRLWKSEQLNIAADAREVLLALCTTGMSAAIEAYWSNSLYLSCMQQAGLLREHAFHQLRGLVAGGEATEANIRRVLEGNPNFNTVEMPGQRELAARISEMEDGT